MVQGKAVSLSSFHFVGNRQVMGDSPETGGLILCRGVVMGPFGVFTHTGKRVGGWRTNSSSQDGGGCGLYGHNTLPLAWIISFFFSFGVFLTLQRMYFYASHPLL